MKRRKFLIKTQKNSKNQSVLKIETKAKTNLVIQQVKKSRLKAKNLTKRK